MFFVILTEDRSGRVLSKRSSKFYNHLPHFPLVDIKVKKFYITTSRKRSAGGSSELSIQDILWLSTIGKLVGHVQTNSNITTLSTVYIK